MTRDALVLMTKMPEPGRVKTRLGVAPEKAARLLEAFLTDLIAEHASQGAYELIAAVDPGKAETAFRERFGIARTVPQKGAGLGDRLARVIAGTLRSHDRVAVIGSDLPHLDAATVRDALDTLDTDDVCLGPAQDGGYYLIAMSQEWPLFEGIPWSTPEVLARTLDRAGSLGLRVHLLKKLRDVDTPEDLKALANAIGPEACPATWKLMQELECVYRSSFRR